MRKLKLKIFLIAFVLSMLSNAINAASVRVDVNNIWYIVDDVAKTAAVYGLVSSSTTINNLIIPDFIDYNGTHVPVISIKRQCILFK